MIIYDNISNQLRKSQKSNQEIVHVNIVQKNFFQVRREYSPEKILIHIWYFSCLVHTRSTCIHKQNKYIITKTLIIKYQIPDSKPDAYATDVGSRSKW